MTNLPTLIEKVKALIGADRAKAALQARIGGEGHV